MLDSQGREHKTSTHFFQSDWEDSPLLKPDQFVEAFSNRVDTCLPASFVPRLNQFIDMCENAAADCLAAGDTDGYQEFWSLRREWLIAICQIEFNMERTKQVRAN